MSRRNKIIGGIFALLLLGAELLFVGHLRSRAAQARRDEEYEKVISSYRQALHPGMMRTEVADYLQSHNLNYTPIYWGGQAWAYAIKIGEDPSHEWYCDHWIVYIGIEFNSPSKARPDIEPSPTDTLQEIRIKKLGTCL